MRQGFFTVWGPSGVEGLQADAKLRDMWLQVVDDSCTDEQQQALLWRRWDYRLRASCQQYRCGSMMCVEVTLLQKARYVPMTSLGDGDVDMCYCL